MKWRLVSVLIGLLVLAWCGASGLIGKNNQQYFDLAIDKLTTGQAKHLAEVEVLNYQKTLLGASAVFKLIPTTTLLNANLSEKEFLLKLTNGPVFISQAGIQFGLSRWELTENTAKVPVNAASLTGDLFSSTQPIATLVHGFSDKALLRAEMANLALDNILLGQLIVEGEINTADLQHKLTLQASDLIYRSPHFALRFPDANLVSNHLAESNTSTAKELTKLSIEADAGELLLAGDSKKVPFHLRSHGSIWFNNDTLSSDWQINTATGKPISSVVSDISKQPNHLQADISLQFRDLLIGGFAQYLQNQSDIFSVLQQAEWAMEEVETPEQQDFLRSLLLDAERIQQSQSDNPLKPLLIAERSQLAINATVTNGDAAPSQLFLGGSALSHAKEPALMLQGQVKVTQNLLNDGGLALLEKWNNRQWLRRYETDFESDITVRNERLLLNNFVVSVEGLSAELSQALVDQ